MHKNKAKHDRTYYEKHKEEVLKGNKRWREKNPEKNRLSIRNSKLKYLYGISLDDYNRMFKEQNGCCKICGKHQTELKKTLNVDHCHSTDRIRGLLCWDCNIGISKFLHNKELLLSAAKYL